MKMLPNLLDRHRRAVVLAAALVAGGWRLAFLDRPLAPDEGGLLLVARQWEPGGGSLYGGYFVDRPPGLVALVGWADAIGGQVALRLTAALAVVLSVLLAYALGRLTTGRRHGGTAAAVAAGVYLSLPSFGVLDLNAEMLACPVVLAGLVALLRALRAVDENVAAVWWWSCCAGIAAAGAVGLKQNLADVFVVAAAATAGLLWSGRRRAALVLAGAVAAGSLTVTAALVSLAWHRGTSPPELWQSLVTFRFEALRVVEESASDANLERALLLVASLLASGALVVLAAGWVAARRSSSDTTVPTAWLLLPLVAYEAVGVLLGGSWWLHYLLLLTPALCWSAALMVTVRGTRRALVVTLGWGLAVAATGIAVATAVPLDTPTDRAVVRYLERHARPGDTATVAFGRPNILAETGLASPYEQLWSMPVRVLDPRLADLTRLLRSDHRPTWVVTAGDDLDTWGVDATRANRVLDRHYEVAQHVEGATIYRSSGPPVS